jgi:hypothetical protein
MITNERMFYNGLFMMPCKIIYFTKVLMAEEWRVIPTFPKYEASNSGKIRKSRKELTKTKTKGGYQVVGLRRTGVKNERFATVPVHQMIMLAFVGEPQAHQVVDHINGDKCDNRVENLRYCTQQQNMFNRVNPRGALSSKYKGVYKRGFKYYSRIMVDGHEIAITSSYSEKVCARAYNEKATELMKEFSRLNEVSDGD